MRFSLPAIGLTAALLFGAHIDAYLDPLSQQNYVRASTETTEAVTLTNIKRDTETVAKPMENDATVSTPTPVPTTTTAETTPTATPIPTPTPGPTMTTNAKAPVALSEEETEKEKAEEAPPLSHTAEFKKNVSEVGKALKEGIIAATKVLNGAVSLVAPIMNIAIDTVTLVVSLATLVWFAGKATYTAGLIISEFTQSFAAQK